MSAASPTTSEAEIRPLILLVEDEVLVRATLANMLEASDFRVVPVANADEALQILTGMPDISAVVTDVKLASSSMDGFTLARQISEQRKIGVVVISGHATPQPSDLPPEVYFIAKPIHRATLVHLVRDVIDAVEQTKRSPQTANQSSAAGTSSSGFNLTPRQKQVLELLVEGRTNQEIAQALGLSENTVKVHLAAVFRNLGVSSRVEAVLAGMRSLAPK